MCGIVGYAGAAQAGPLLLEGLARLEYRGYDAAGVAVQGDAGEIAIVREAGRLENLAKKTDCGRSLDGCCGVGHTRWATHGAPDKRNAHPHASPGNRVAIVHNGIIANHRALRAELEAEGCVFLSETDTEAAVLLLDRCYTLLAGKPPRARAVQALMEMAARLEGSYAICALFADQPGAVYAVRRGSPLAAGRCSGAQAGYMIASDVHALAGYAEAAVFLEDGEIAVMTRDALRLYDAAGKPAARPPEPIDADAGCAKKGGYAHFMLKEMHEQPRAVRDTLAPFILRDGDRLHADLSAAGLDEASLLSVRRVLLTGCGSAFHAGLAGRAMIERLAGIPCEAELASEWPSRLPPLEGTLAVVISQSGETADSLAALRLLRAQGVRTLALVNAPHAAMAREADRVLLTRAGQEIAVATTKAYAAQMAALGLLAVRLAAAKGRLAHGREHALLRALLDLPEALKCLLGEGESIKRIAREIGDAQSVFFIGRGIDAAAAMEGALKLKEVSYIHAQAYPAGELKHGTLSLIERGTPVIAVCTQREQAERMRASMAEAASRGARCILIAGEGCAEEAEGEVIRLPGTEPLFAPLLAAVPMQQLAYEAGCTRGNDVDRPRNLAKSVTVE